MSLPWNVATEDNLDLRRARRVLDEDHYDLEKVKERIVEYLAVSKLKADLSGPILCFVGPPGVGKTSLGQSIARTLDRKFVRISVGGVRDESEIRGHRRTYIGAMPGTVIRAIRDAGARNPVFMIDEIDKMGADWRGDPASAMLEVLDPEQHSTFRDHYLDLPFDLSRVLFICTANQLEPIPAPLRDRMEIIELSGYTEDEKVAIARRYLIPKQVEANGLEPGQAVFTDRALRLLVREYTREAGVRGLERQIGALCRKTASQVAEGKLKRARIDEKRVRSWLGPRRYSSEVRKRTSGPGVATGLAVTAVGGDVLFVEATSMSGKGSLTITGQLGEVMRESAQAALSWVRSHSIALGVHDTWFEDNDIHVHVPAGAVPKDGPSAGITIVTALVSLVTGRPVSDEIAMTGEITLTGQVLPIGGVKEKVLAAQRAGIGDGDSPERERARPRGAPDGRPQGDEVPSRRVRRGGHRAGARRNRRDGDRHEPERAEGGSGNVFRSVGPALDWLVRGRDERTPAMPSIQTLTPSMDTLKRVVAVKAAIDAASPIVKELARDEKLRRQLANAFGTTRDLYGEHGGSSARAVAARIAVDPEFVREVQKTSQEIRKATTRAKKAQNRHRTRNTMLIVSGVVAAVLFNPLTGPDTRRWIREKAFGPEETFEYEA